MTTITIDARQLTDTLNIFRQDGGDDFVLPLELWQILMKHAFDRTISKTEAEIYFASLQLEKMKENLKNKSFEDFWNKVNKVNKENK